MSSSLRVQQFLDRLEELRALFVLGRRSVPMLEELFSFVQDVTALLEEVNATIHAHDGDMPRATSKLKSVSEATELATNEILDFVDEVLHQLGGLEEQFDTVEHSFEALAEADERLLALLEEELGAEHATTVKKAKALCEEKRALRAEGANQLAAAREALPPLRTRMNKIMMSLQVQDITSQQIASVNHLIESVRTRMDALLKRLGPAGPQGADRSATAGGAQKAEPAREERRASEAAPQAGTFDPEARYDHSPDRQQMADDLVSSMFAQGEVGGDGEAGNDGSAAGDAADPQSPQGNGGGKETTSQGDIDELFEQGL